MRKTRTVAVLTTLLFVAAAAAGFAGARTGVEVTAPLGDEKSPAYVKASAPAAQGQARVASLTVLSTTTLTPARGQPRLVSSASLRRHSDGSFSQKTTHYGEDGSASDTEHLVAEPGRGVFRVDERRRLLVLLAPLPDGLTALTEEELRRSPRFMREDSVLGRRTLVLRYPVGADGQSYLERHFAPDLQCVLKEVSTSARAVRVTEATEVTLGEPDRSDLAPLSAYGVDASALEEKLRRVERAEGDSATARELRGHVTRAKRGR